MDRKNRLWPVFSILFHRKENVFSFAKKHNFLIFFFDDGKGKAFSNNIFVNIKNNFCQQNILANKFWPINHFDSCAKIVFESYHTVSLDLNIMICHDFSNSKHCVYYGYQKTHVSWWYVPDDRKTPLKLTIFSKFWYFEISLYTFHALWSKAGYACIHNSAN